MDSGKCGKNLTWWLNGDTLTISGIGDMKTYFNGVGKKVTSPWSKNNSIKKIILKEGVKTIGEAAFFHCVNLKEIIIPDSVSRIGSWAFAGCMSLTNITLPENVTYIGELAFAGCESLKNITIPANVAEISFWIFRGCTSLERIYYWYHEENDFGKILSEDNNAQLIPFEKLWWKVEDKTLTVGGVREIKAYSYEETPWRDSLNDIQRIIIEEGVEEISARAFEECRRLEQLTIPASVKTIGDMAFSFCYCGDWRANGGKNVYWTLEDGVLNLKKNLDVKNETDFSTGAVSWINLDKNITGIKLEAGIVPKEKFFAWHNKRSNALQITFG